MARIKDSSTGKFINPNIDRKYLDKEWLAHQYINLNRTTRDIGKECNVDKKLISNALKSFKIPIRNTNREYALLDPKPYMNKAWLEKEYLTKSSTQIAKECKCSSDIIRKWMRYYNIPVRSLSNCRKGKLHSRFKGGNWINAQGYKMVYQPNHPRLSRSKAPYIRPYIREHILVMEKHLNRILEPGEEIHHINGDKLDNRIENLQLFKSSKEHITYEMQLRDFAKKLIFGSLPISNRQEILELFNNFIKEQG